MSSTIRIRPAVDADIPFLARAIVEAEKSGTDTFGLGLLFGADETRMEPYIRAMLQEDIDGCDYAVSSFLVAEEGDRPVAAVSGWVEEGEEEPPSHCSRANLFGHVLPAGWLLAARERRDIIAPLTIEREPGTLQIEHVFVEAYRRGNDLAARLIAAHVARALERRKPPAKAQVQVMANNPGALRTYERCGFRIVRTLRSHDPRIAGLLPHHIRLLLEMDLQHRPA